MINDFIAITDNFYTKEQCEEYINFIEHYVNHGLIVKEDEKFHDRNHFTMNFNNDVEFDLLAGDNLSLKFLPSINTLPIVGSKFLTISSAIVDFPVPTPPRIPSDCPLLISKLKSPINSLVEYVLRYLSFTKFQPNTGPLDPEKTNLSDLR